MAYTHARKSRTRRLSTLLIACAVLLAASLPSLARDLAVPESELVAVELSSVGVEPLTGTPVALLREPGGGGVVPIFIGPSEARAILLALREVEVPRPMTHDLMAKLLSVTGAEMEALIVDELRNGTYMGALKLRIGSQDGPVFIDSRPSDGMALALRTGAAIRVAPAVLEAGADLEFEGLGPEDQVVAALGITVVEATPELRQALQLPERPGVLVSHISPLVAWSGIRAGALIFEVNGASPDNPMDFLEKVNQTPAGGKARLRFWREGEEAEAELPLDVPERAPRDAARQRI